MSPGFGNYISSKSCHTSKFRCPWNVTAYFSQLIPINAALESRRMVQGWQIYVCTHALYVYTNRLIIEAAYACACWSQQTPPLNWRCIKQEISRKHGNGRMVELESLMPWNKVVTVCWKGGPLPCYRYQWKSQSDPPILIVLNMASCSLKFNSCHIGPVKVNWPG